MTKYDILKWWSEYIEELFQNECGEEPVIRKDLDMPDIIEEEVRKALMKMKAGKVVGPDNIAVEMIEALDDFGIAKTAEMANSFYSSGNFPPELTKSAFVAIPKKPGAIECEFHRKISLMSYVTKTILHVLIDRLRTSRRPDISPTQCGYVTDKGTRNTIFMLRVLPFGGGLLV